MKKVLLRLSFLAIWALVLVLVLAVAKDLARAKKIEAQIEAEKAKIAKIKEENTKLEVEIARANSPEFIETQVRNKLGLGKPGEAVVVLPDEDVLRQLAPKLEENRETLPDPNWKKWGKLFF